MTTYEIKNLKTLSSGAYTATLYRDGKRIATIEDDGRGGEPSLWATVKDATWRETDVIRQELTAWAAGLPEWYMTSWGQHEKLEPHWELAIGYLSEVAEINKSARKGRIIRKADGTEWINATPKPGEHFWTGSTWEEVA